MQNETMTEQELDKLSAELIIKEVIKNFFNKNEMSKSLKKELEPLNARIKEYFRSAGERQIEVDDILAEFSVREGSSTMHPDLLMKKLKKLKLKHLIKKVEIVDTAAFEKLIYDQELDASLFADCVVTGSSTEVLVVKKQKAKKADKE